MDSASIVADAIAAATASGGLLAWLQARRRSAGRVGTSEAAVLWEQTQAIITTLSAQRDKAEAQRDRLIESQATQVLPALEGINDGLEHLTQAVAGNTEALARLEARAGG